MKLLIATPAYGSQFTLGYVASLIDSIFLLNKSKDIEFQTFFLGGESLISRGRNKCADAFLRGGFDKLLFIDSDLTWTPEDLRLLLESDKPLIGGTYPLKAFPITINFNPLDSADETFRTDRSYDNFRRFAAKYANEKGEAEVKHIPTGFMLIDRAVFEHVADFVPLYRCFQPDKGITEHLKDYFPSGARDGGYESEDWAFCRLARSAGIPVYLQTKVICGHTGSHTYEPGQWYSGGQRPLLDGPLPPKLEDGGPQ